MTALALTGFPRRIGIYLAEMYPVFQRLALAALIYGALAVFAGHEGTQGRSDGVAEEGAGGVVEDGRVGWVPVGAVGTV